jgi:hypothetical protein
MFKIASGNFVEPPHARIKTWLAPHRLAAAQ